MRQGTEQYWLQRCSAADIQRSDAFGCVTLVAGDGEQIDPQDVDGDLDLTDCLGGVRMGDDPGPSRRGSGRRDRHDRPSFVLRQHDRQQRYVGVQRLDHGVGVDGSAGRDRQAGYRPSLGFQEVARARRGWVLDLGGDDAAPAGICSNSAAPNGKVVGLSAAGGEDDLLWYGADQ